MAPGASMFSRLETPPLSSCFKSRPRLPSAPSTPRTVPPTRRNASPPKSPPNSGRESKRVPPLHNPPVPAAPASMWRTIPNPRMPLNPSNPSLSPSRLTSHRIDTTAAAEATKKTAFIAPPGPRASARAPGGLLYGDLCPNRANPPRRRRQVHLTAAIEPTVLREPCFLLRDLAWHQRDCR